MIHPATELLLELYQANSARAVYEEAFELPLDDLFLVGTRLRPLIQRAESNLCSATLPPTTQNILRTRLADAKAFYGFILRRIQAASEGFLTKEKAHETNNIHSHK